MSRNLCSVKDCKNTKHENPKLTFHNFPTKEADRCQKWVEFCENQTLSELFEKNDPKLEHKSICSEHFEDNKYNNPLKKIRLMCNALPTLKTNQKKQTVDYIQCHPRVEVIPAQLLLRTNLSRSWRPKTSCLSLTDSVPIQVINTQRSEGQQKGSLNPRANPIVKQFSAQHFRHLEEIKSLKEQLVKTKKQVMNLKYRLKRSNPVGNTRKSKMNYIIKSIKSLSEEVLNPVMSEVIEYHLISAFLNKPRVPKWTNRMKKFCADLFHKSPTAYSFLQKTMTLPTKKTILKFTEDRIQIAKKETFKQTVCETNDKQIDYNINQLDDKYNENVIISCDPINEILTNNDINITIEYNTCDQTSESIIPNDIDSNSTIGDAIRPLTTQITLVDN